YYTRETDYDFVALPPSLILLVCGRIHRTINSQTIWLLTFMVKPTDVTKPTERVRLIVGRIKLSGDSPF
ncbi:hypothetical protein, partial [Yersinia pestis]